jgi:uncharacterized protein YjgD (DUF1641 family)
MGTPQEEIAKEVSKETKTPVSLKQVQNIIRKQSVRKKEFLQADAEFAQIYKNSIFKLLNKAEDNIDILEKTRDMIVKKIDELNNTSEDGKLIAYFNQILGAIRAQNDTIRTLNEVLKRLESETKEVEVSTIQSINQTLEILKQLEDDGLIKINPGYYKSEIYKAHSDINEKSFLENEEEEIKNE